eukprot:1620445-Amphidinium_carterae.1
MDIGLSCPACMLLLTVYIGCVVTALLSFACCTNHAIVSSRSATTSSYLAVGAYSGQPITMVLVAAAWRSCCTCWYRLHNVWRCVA